MPENKKRISADQAVALLKASAKKRRVSRWTILAFVLLLFGVPLGLAAWYFWPRPGPPRMLIVAFDELALPGDEVRLHAQLEPLPDEQPVTRLSGWNIAFLEKSSAFVPGQQVWQAATKSDEAGSATELWKIPADRKVQLFVARYEPAHRQAMAEDAGWIYCVPANTSLLFVDVERSVADAKLTDWGTKDNSEIAAKPGATAALAQLAEQTKLQLVYLACAVPGSRQYRQVRNWVHHMKLPPGPVLGRAQFASSTVEKDQLLQWLHDLKKKFAGKMIGISTHAQTAQLFQEEGLQTYFLDGTEQAPPGVIAVGDWPAIAKRILENEK
jgi:hypothetical protein